MWRFHYPGKDVDFMSYATYTVMYFYIVFEAASGGLQIKEKYLIWQAFRNIDKNK